MKFNFLNFLALYFITLAISIYLAAGHVPVEFRMAITLIIILLNRQLGLPLFSKKEDK